jgi:hypothetical protein
LSTRWILKPVNRRWITKWRQAWWSESADQAITYSRSGSARYNHTGAAAKC